MKVRKDHSEINPAQCLERAASCLREGRFMLALEHLDSADNWLYENEGKHGAAAIRRRLLDLDREARRMMDQIMRELPFGKTSAPTKERVENRAIYCK